MADRKTLQRHLQDLRGKLGVTRPSHPSKVAKIYISGTGRAGTTFIIRLLTELGLDTVSYPRLDACDQCSLEHFNAAAFDDGFHSARQFHGIENRTVRHAQRGDVPG